MDEQDPSAGGSADRLTETPDDATDDISRREMVARSGLAFAALSLGVGACGGEPRTAGAAVPEATPLAAPSPEALTVTLVINGQSRRLDVDSRVSLLDTLRERLALTGAKKGCDHGQCGACTVHVDGRRVAACLTLAAKADGRAVTTIEGLSEGGRLHPIQQAFIDHDALQCGYCTPGQIMAAVACVAEGNATSKERIREYMSGNICRCGAYVGIVAAIEDASPKMRRA